MSKEASYELSGLCFCGECGAAFYYRRKRHKGDTIIYSNCSTLPKERHQPLLYQEKPGPTRFCCISTTRRIIFHIEAATEIENEKAAGKEQVAKKNRNLKRFNSGKITSETYLLIFLVIRA